MLQDQIMDPIGVYQGLRNRALEVRPADVSIELQNAEQVYAILIDFKEGDHEYSLFLTADGTVSLYFDDRPALIDLGEVETVQDAANAFLVSASQVVPGLHKDVDPEYDKERITLLTRDRNYEVNVNQDTGLDEVKFLDFLTQNVMRSIREAGALEKGKMDEYQNNVQS